MCYGFDWWIPLILYIIHFVFHPPYTYYLFLLFALVLLNSVQSLCWLWDLSTSRLQYCIPLHTQPPNSPHSILLGSMGGGCGVDWPANITKLYVNTMIVQNRIIMCGHEICTRPSPIHHPLPACTYRRRHVINTYLRPVRVSRMSILRQPDADGIRCKSNVQPIWIN